MTVYSSLRDPLSIAQLSSLLQELAQREIPELWVQGEVKSAHMSNGHCYIDLIEETNAGTAKLNAVVWRYDQPRMPRPPQIGEHIVAYGLLSFYAPRSDYRLVIKRFEPQGQGAAQAALAALFNRLKEEGLFDPSRKRKLPFLPRAIGIVTSREGAALTDILKTLGTGKKPNQTLVGFCMETEDMEERAKEKLKTLLQDLR